MFRIEHNVPDVYIQESRDFQLVARLYDLVIQSSRFSINSMEDIASSKYCNERLLELTKTKVGFFSSTEVDEHALRCILTAYPYIIRCKGTTRAIQLVISLFQRLTLRAIEGFELETDRRIVRIILSKPITYLQMLQDLLEEVLPAGYMLEFSVRTQVTLSNEGYTVQDNVLISKPEHSVDGFKRTNVVASDNTANTFTEIGTTQIVDFQSYYKQEFDSEEVDPT